MPLGVDIKFNWGPLAKKEASIQKTASTSIDEPPTTSVDASLASTQPSSRGPKSKVSDDLTTIYESKSQLDEHTKSEQTSTYQYKDVGLYEQQLLKKTEPDVTQGTSDPNVGEGYENLPDYTRKTILATAKETEEYEVEEEEGFWELLMSHRLLHKRRTFGLIFIISTILLVTIILGIVIATIAIGLFGCRDKFLEC